MDRLQPTTAEELADRLRENAARGRHIQLGGRFSKNAMAGPMSRADVQVSTAALNRLLNYNPADLTISVEAGMPWRQLQDTLAAQGQTIPLDPPFAEESTVGGVIAANLSGPRRRLYGTARDQVIGMRFVTLEGKIVQSGGMVVKNVAGLDMAKLMIGSFGTLAAVVSVNFKLQPLPPETNTFVFRCPDAAQAMAYRDRVIKSVLQPMAVDLLDPKAAWRVGFSEPSWLLLVRAGGSGPVLNRYAMALPEAERITDDARLWRQINEFTRQYLKDYPDGGVARISTTLSRIGKIAAQLPGPLVARAASGVLYTYAEDAAATLQLVQTFQDEEATGVVEYAPSDRKQNELLWPRIGTDFAIMERVKDLFDPDRLLNRQRLYGRI